MSGTSMFDFLKDAANDGNSVWVFQGKKYLTYVASHLKSIPKLNSNYAYAVISLRHGLQVLGDQHYNSIKVYFWVGARCLDYESNY